MPASRVKVDAMARQRRNPTVPSVPKTIDAVKSFRLPVELAEKMDEARGLVPESVWLRERLVEILTNPEQRALMRICDEMQLQGISRERLMRYWAELDKEK